MGNIGIGNNSNDKGSLNQIPGNVASTNPASQTEATQAYSHTGTQQRQLLDYDVTSLHTSDSTTATIDHQSVNPTGITANYTGTTSNESLFTLAHNLNFEAAPGDELAQTLTHPLTFLRRNLIMLDNNHKALAESENFFSAEDLKLKDKPEFAQNVASDDLSKFSLIFPGEESHFADKFDEQLKKEATVAMETSADKDSEKSTIVELSQTISKSLDGHDEQDLIAMLFKRIFQTKRENSDITQFAQNLLTKRLKAKLAIVARDFTKELSADEQSIFLLHSLIDSPQKELDELYKVIFNKALEKIEPDVKYLDHSFFEGKYTEGLRRAIELELGAYKKDFRASEIGFENSSRPEDITVKNTIAKQLNARNPLPPVFADVAIETPSVGLLQNLSRRVSNFRSGSVTESNKEYKTQIIQPLADTLRRYNPRLDDYHPNIKDSVAEIYLDSVEALARAKALQIFKAGKETALEDQEFFKAIINKDHETILASLKKHFGDEHIQDPLRRFFILSRIASDSDFTRRIDLAKQERSRNFRKQPIVKWGLPTVAVSLLGTAVTLATAGYQDSRDIYGKHTALLTDSIDVDFRPNLKSIEAKLNQSEQWDQKRIFTTEEIIEAGKSELISKTKSPVNYLLSRILPLLENSKDLKDSPIISIDFNDSPREAKEQLLGLMQSMTGLFDDLKKEEMEQIAENYFSAYDKMQAQFLSHRPDTPMNFIPVSFKDAKGQEKEFLVLDAQSLQECLKPFTDDNPTNLQMPRIFELATSFTSTEANRNFFRHCISEDSERPYFKDPIDFMKRGGAKGFPKFVNGLGSEIDNLRRALNLKGLRD